MKTLFIATVVCLSLGFTTSERTSVYICMSPNAKKYHLNKNCAGLRSCTHTIKTVTVEKAKKLGLTACSKEQQRTQ